MNKNIAFLLVTSAVVTLNISCEKDNIPENKLPAVNAGPSKTITLYVDSTTLEGSATDEDGQVVAWQWSQVSGPHATTIVNPGNSATQVKGFKEGTYIFQLLATDNKGTTAHDTAMVVVNPSPVVTLTLQPANNPDEALIVNHNGNSWSGNGGVPEFVITAWTSGSTPYTVRGIIKFDLSSIPVNAKITSANLYLYSHPGPLFNGDKTNANHGSANTMLVQQVTSNWTLTGMSFSHLPMLTTNNQVVVPHTTQPNLDLNLDVTNMVSSMVSGNANYGFYFKLQHETYYNSRIFVASANTTHAAKIPKLVVVYQ